MAERLVYRGEESGFEFMEAGRAYAFDADGGLLRLTSEASARPSGTRCRPVAEAKLHRFYGSVEIDMVCPMNSFDAILNAVVMELQRTRDAKVTLTLEIEAEASEGFAESEVGVVRDNARQLKIETDSTCFE